MTIQFVVLLGIGIALSSFVIGAWAGMIFFVHTAAPGLRPTEPEQVFLWGRLSGQDPWKRIAKAVPTSSGWSAMTYKPLPRGMETVYSAAPPPLNS